MTTIIRAAGPADFLALVPHLLEYRPARSLVLIPFDGSRSLGALRLDLPESTAVADLEATSASALGMVCKVRSVDAVAAVVYTDHVLGAEGVPPHHALAAALTAQAHVCGLRVSAALCVGPDGWASYLDDEDPPRRHPLSEIPDDHDVLPDAPTLERDQAAGADLPPCDLAAKERVARALRDIDGALEDAFAPAVRGERPSAAPVPLLATHRLDDLPMLFETALALPPNDLDPPDAAALVWCLSRPGLRDVALVQWTRDLAGGDEALEAQLEWMDGAPYPERLAAPMWGDGPSPDPERLQRALTLARHLAAVAPRECRPGALSAAAWLSWALGSGTHAARYADLAREIDPEHGLAGIVLTFVANAHLPEWVYRRSTPRGAVTRVVDSRGAES